MTAPDVETIRIALTTLLVLVAAFFLTVGTIGLLRFPDVYNRMHATTKATTLGAATLFLAAWVRFGPLGDGLPALLGIAFLFVTAPAGAHVISRAAVGIAIPFYRTDDGDSNAGAGGADSDGHGNDATSQR